jgi:hypothetical protein
MQGLPFDPTPPPKSPPAHAPSVAKGFPHTQGNSGGGNKSKGSASGSTIKNDPNKIDSAMGWVLFATIGGLVFILMGQNLVPYAILVGNLAAATVAPFQQWWITRFLIYWPVRLMGMALGVLLFSVIQYLEVRPQLLRKWLPNGNLRNQKLFWAYLLTAAALVVDIFFCLLFWPPVNSPLGWSVFRAGFAPQLLNRMNMIRTFATLFGGMILVAVHTHIKKRW